MPPKLPKNALKRKHGENDEDYTDDIIEEDESKRSRGRPSKAAKNEKELEIEVIAVRLIIEDSNHSYYYAHGRTESFPLDSIIGYKEGNIKKSDVTKLIKQTNITFYRTNLIYFSLLAALRLKC